MVNPTPAPTNEETIGRVLAIAVRSGARRPMIEIVQALARVDGGLEGDYAARGARGISFLAAAQWKAVTRELSADLPWHTRRSNVLVDAAGLAHLIGRRIRLGEIEVRVKGETAPCGLMDTLHPGLRAALHGECRGGVYGRVLRGGQFRVGDALRLLD
jgi:MOSC domain-containing protein YiiM